MFLCAGAATTVLQGNVGVVVSGRSFRENSAVAYSALGMIHICRHLPPREQGVAITGIWRQPQTTAPHSCVDHRSAYSLSFFLAGRRGPVADGRRPSQGAGPIFDGGAAAQDKSIDRGGGGWVARAWSPSRSGSQRQRASDAMSFIPLRGYCGRKRVRLR